MGGVAVSIYIIVSYIIGSIPCSWLLVRWVGKIDLRNFGSGNIGATNARRAVGSRWGAIALVGDILKGVLPVFGAKILFGDGTYATHSWLIGVVGVAAIMGHIYPVFFSFKPSGKGVATAIGSFLVIMPLATVVMLLVLIVSVIVWKRMSVGSMLGMVILPIAGWFIYHDSVLLLCSALVMLIIIFRHKDNIRRLLQGVEPTITNKAND